MHYKLWTRRIAARLGLGLAVAGSLLSLSAARVAAADEAPYEIHVVASLTGFGAFVGQANATTLRLMEGLLNKQGGIRGRQIKFIIADDASNPQTAVQLVSQLAASKVPLIIGPGLGATCAAVAPITALSGPVTWCTSPVVSPASRGYMFATGSTGEDSVRVLLRYFRDRGLKRVAVISSTDASGQVYDRGVRYAQEEYKDLSVVASEHFNAVDISVQAQLARIKAANPDVLLTLTTGTPWATVMRGINDIGLNIPIGSANGNMIVTQLVAYKPFLPKEVYFPGMIAIVPHSVRRGPIADAQAPYFTAFEEARISPDAVTINAWDPALILVGALRTLGTDVAPSRLRDYLLDLHGFAGINGLYDFRDGLQRGIGINALVVDRWDRDAAVFTPVSRPAGHLK
jgi:branched-chain amino acid transport system substrate-binding protein